MNRRFHGIKSRSSSLCESFSFFSGSWSSCLRSVERHSSSRAGLSILCKYSQSAIHGRFKLNSRNHVQKRPTSSLWRRYQYTTSTTKAPSFRPVLLTFKLEFPFSAPRRETTDQPTANTSAAAHEPYGEKAFKLEVLRIQALIRLRNQIPTHL